MERRQGSEKLVLLPKSHSKTIPPNPFLPNPCKEPPNTVDFQRTILRSWWEFQSTAHFLSIFFSQFGDSSDFDTLRLEDYVLLLNAPDDTWLEDLNVKMLRMTTKNRFIMPDCWLMYFDREYLKRNNRSLFKWTEDLGWRDLDLRKRVLILHFQCELFAERPDLFKPFVVTNELEAKHWRVDPVGQDSLGNTYWLFDDSRLFMEPCKKTHPRDITMDMPNPNWVLKCLTLDDWVALLAQYENTTSQRDRLFYNYLVKVIPHIEHDLNLAKEKRDKFLERPSPICLDSKKQIQINLREQERQTEEILEMIEQETEEPRYGTRRTRNKKYEEPITLSAAELRAKRLQEREQRIAEQHYFTGDSSQNGEFGQRRKRQRKERKRSQFDDSEEEEEFSDEREDQKDEEMADLGDESGLDQDDQYEGEDADEGGQEVFLCICDGQDSIACSKCGTWQHFRCVLEARGEDPYMELWEWEGKQFICDVCARAGGKRKRNSKRSLRSDEKNEENEDVKVEEAQDDEQMPENDDAHPEGESTEDTQEGRDAKDTQQGQETHDNQESQDDQESSNEKQLKREMSPSR